MIGLAEHLEVARKLVLACEADGVAVDGRYVDLFADNMDLGLSYIIDVLAPAYREKYDSAPRVRRDPAVVWAWCAEEGAWLIEYTAREFSIGCDPSDSEMLIFDPEFAARHDAARNEYHAARFVQAEGLHQ